MTSLLAASLTLHILYHAKEAPLRDVSAPVDEAPLWDTSAPVDGAAVSFLAYLNFVSSLLSFFTRRATSFGTRQLRSEG